MISKDLFSLGGSKSDSNMDIRLKNLKYYFILNIVTLCLFGNFVNVKQKEFGFIFDHLEIVLEECDMTV